MPPPDALKFTGTPSQEDTGADIEATGVGLTVTVTAGAENGQPPKVNIDTE